MDREERYYEWLKKGKDRIPHFTKHSQPGKLMLLAGLYDRVVLPGATKPLYTFTIVTTDANRDFRWLHDRQPVILSTQAALHTWLDTSSQTWSAELTQLVKPYHDAEHPLEWCAKISSESLMVHMIYDLRATAVATKSRRRSAKSGPSRPTLSARSRSANAPNRTARRSTTPAPPSSRSARRTISRR